MNISYKILLQIIESFASEHLQIKKFSSDFPEQLPNFATKDESYPILFVSPSNSISNLNTKIFSVTIYCYDLIQQDRGNINTVLSDTHSILNDLILWFNDDNIPHVDIINSSSIDPLNNSLLDYCAGWSLKLTVEVNNSTVCDIPFNETPAIIEIKNDIIYSKYLTCETLSDCPVIIDIQNTLTGLTSDTYVTGGTYSNGVTTFRNNKNNTFNVSGYSIDSLTATTLDSNIGSRLKPVNSVSNGFNITKSVNGQVGMYIKNSDNTGNGALSTINAMGSGTGLYDKGMSINFANNGYFITYLRNSGFIYSDSPLNIVGQTLALRVGALSTPTTVLTASTNGQISLPTLPTLDNTTTALLGRKSDGSLVTLDKSSVTYSGANVGTVGSGIFKDITGNTFNFRNIVNAGGIGVAINNTDNTIELTNQNTRIIDMTDTFFGTLAPNDIIQWDGTNWVNVQSDNLIEVFNPTGSTLVSTTKSGAIKELDSKISVIKDIRVTGGTYSNNTFTYTNNTGGTFNTSFNTVTGLTVNGGLIVTGNTSMTGTLSVTGNTSVRGITGTSATISGSGQSILTVIGSGTTNPIFSVQGSSGELFNVTDSLIGSLFSVNDISGLPIIEVFSDNTILMGNYLVPSLNTTAKISLTAGTNTIYSIPTSAYTGAFIDYTVISSGNTSARAGNVMTIWNSGSTQYTEVSTNDIGSTTGVTFSTSLSGTNTLISASATTAGWTLKAIIRTI